jgi:hypothetical protein
MASLICAQLLVILLVGGLRFGPDAVLPGAGPVLWRSVVVLVGIGLASALTLEARRGQAPWRRRGRLLLWLVFPVASAINWGLGGTSLAESPDLPALALIFGLAATILVLRHREWAGRETTGAAWRTGAVWLLVPTALVCTLAVLHETRMATGTGLALATYPLYAAAQLGAALVLPWTQWERDGISRGHRVVAATILFALVHWPNPFATAATAAGMALWALAWRAGSAFIPLALSMGIMATFVTQGLPESMTGHMRVGSNQVVKSREIAHEVWLDGEAWRLDQAGAWTDAEGLRPWLARALEALEDAPVDSALVEETARMLERLHRQASLRWIFDADEFRQRHGFDEPFRDDELRFFESTFVPYHPGHAGYSELVAASVGMSTREFVAMAYRRFLGREPRETEFAHWPEPITAGNRWLFLRRVVEGGGLRGWNEPENEDARERLRAYRAARGQ